MTGVEPRRSRCGSRARSAGDVLPGSLEEPLPLADASFDLASRSNVLEHVRERHGGAGELARVLVPGGRLLVTVPQYGWLWGERDVLSHHHRRYTRSLLLARAAAAGLRAECVSVLEAVRRAEAALVRRGRDLPVGCR